MARLCRQFVVVVLVLGAMVASVRAESGIIDFATQDPSLLIAGDAASENLGTDLVMGDLDGDGVGDLVIGAPWAHRASDERFAGHVYIFFGGQERPTSLSGDEADVTIIGAAANDAIGGGFDRQPGTIAVGDVNGDAFNDLVLGVPGLGSGGEVRVIFGRDRNEWDMTPIMDLATMPGDVVVAGADDANDALGSAVAVGDVNGDGIGDLIAGAPRSDGPGESRTNAGEVYIFFGRTSWPGMLSAEDDADVRVIGAQGLHFLGSGLAVGQLGGTDTVDVAMGALGGAGGEVHVLFGSPGLAGMRDLSSAPADWVIFAADAVDDVGRYLAVGDVSGDGQPDLAVGIPGGDGPANGRMEAGEVAVIFGPQASGTVTGLADGADFTIFGPQGQTARRPGGRLGDNIALGDFNNDGVMDLVAGARQGDGASDNLDKTGEAYIIFGGHLPALWDLGTTEADIAIYGRDSGDRLGRVAASNFDSVSPGDVALGAHQADVKDDVVLDSAGKVFVVYRQVAEPTPVPTPTPSTTPTMTVTLPPGTVTATPTATPTPAPGTITPSPTLAPTSTVFRLPLIMKNHWK